MILPRLLKSARLAAARVDGRKRRAALAAGLAGIIAALTIASADPASPLAVTKIDSPDPIASGAELTYTITITNTGGAKVTNVVLTDQLNGVGGIGVPPQLVLTSTRGSCQQNVNLVTCNGGAIEGFGSWVVTIRGIVTAPNGTTINNTVSVTGTKSAQNFTTTTTATTLVSGGGGSPLPDLTISKTGPTTVVKSSPMTYTVVVNNLGTANAMNVKLSDTLPLGLSGVTHATTSLFTCTNDEAAPPFPGAPITVTCVGGAVNQGSNASITINATSPATTGTITNTAAVDPDNTIAEGNELNNTSALVNTAVVDPGGVGQLTVDKTDVDAPGADFSDGAGPDPVTPGGVITYKILATNTSQFRADDVVVVDGTQGLEAASIQVSQVVTDGAIGTFGGCTIVAPQARCSIRSLNPGGTLLMTVSGQVVQAAGSTIINTATVTGNIKNEGNSNTDTELSTVRPAVDLTVTKADDPDPVCARSWPTTTAGGGSIPAPAVPPLLAAPVCLGGLTYTFVLGNSGIQTANNVTLRDPLPAGLIFDHYVDAGGAFPAGACTVGAGNVVTCLGGTLAPASTKTISFVMVAPPGIGPISNTVTIDPSNAIFEADETNNMATETTQVATGVDLTIKKFDNLNNPITGAPNPGFDPIATSGTQIYTILVDNIGPQDVTNIVVRDMLPSNTILRSAQGDHGFTCTQNGNVVDCIGGSLPGTESEFYGGLGAQHATITIKLFAQPIVGTMHNEVRVDPDNLIAEIDESNNIDTEDTVVDKGGAGMSAFNQFTIDKTQVSPDANNTARNAVVTYQILLTNDATDPATGVVVRDFLPAGARYIEAVDDSTPSSHFLCTEAGNVINCVGGELAAGGTAKIKVKAFAPDTPGTYTNQAIVDPDNAIPEGNEFDNQDSQQTIVRNAGAGSFNDLQIEKTPETATIKPNEVITWTLKVDNLGTDPALNVTVRDVLPETGTFISADDVTGGGPPSAAFTCGGESGGAVTCTGGTIAGTDATLMPGVPSTRNIEVKFKAPNQQGTLLNQAFVDPDNAIPEGDELNNTDTATVTVKSRINLTITKTGPTESSQSQVSKYEITVKNNEVDGSGEDAFGVKVVDFLPIGLIPLATTAEPNFGCTTSENPINFVECIGDLGSGEDVKITIDVFQTAENSRSLDNEACVDPDDTIEESNETDNCSKASTSTTGNQPKLKPDIVVIKTVDPSGPVTTGLALTYTVTVLNAGTAKAKGPLTLEDTLPANVTFVNTETTALWSCTFAAPKVTCHEPPAPGGGEGLEPGASATITIHATYDGGATAPLVNTATVLSPVLVDPAPDATHEDETVTDNNTAIAKNTVGGTGIDLVLSTIVDNPDPVQKGQTLTYTVVVVNGGAEDTTTTGKQVKVRLDVPQTGLSFLSVGGSNGFICDPPDVNHKIFCTGDLPAGGDTTITAKFTVVAGAPSALSLSATVDPDNEIPETIEVINNTATQPTTVFGEACPGIPCIDLVAAQLIGKPDPYPNNGTVTMSFTLINIGNSSTSLDPSPAGGEPLAFFDVHGTHTLGATRTVTPTVPGAVTCVNNTAETTGALLTDCFGNLGPGEAVTITVVFTGVTSATVKGEGRADPFNLVPEFVDNFDVPTNNNIVLIINKQP